MQSSDNSSGSDWSMRPNYCRRSLSPQPGYEVQQDRIMVEVGSFREESLHGAGAGAGPIRYESTFAIDEVSIHFQNRPNDQTNDQHQYNREYTWPPEVYPFNSDESMSHYQAYPDDIPLLLARFPRRNTPSHRNPNSSRRSSRRNLPSRRSTDNA